MEIDQSDKLPHLSLRFPLIFLSSKRVRDAKTSRSEKHRLTPVCVGGFWVLSGAFRFCLFWHRELFLTKEISGGNLKERCGNLSGRFP